MNKRILEITNEKVSDWDDVILKHLKNSLKKDLFCLIQKEGSYQFTYGIDRIFTHSSNNHVEITLYAIESCSYQYKIIRFREDIVKKIQQPFNEWFEKNKDKKIKVELELSFLKEKSYFA